MRENKICCKCKETKPLIDFSKDKNSTDGRTYDCKACRSAKFKQWCLDNPEKAKAARNKCWQRRKDFYQRPEQKLKFRKRFIEKKYGIKYEEYEKMLDLQRNACYICNQSEPQKRNLHLAVDHNHKTGQIRKLLCSRCNRVIGLLQENAELVEKIKNYIKQHEKCPTTNLK